MVKKYNMFAYTIVLPGFQSGKVFGSDPKDPWIGSRVGNFLWGC